MDIKEKFGKFLSRDAQDAIKDSEDLEDAVQAVFYLVAAGKGDKPLKPHLIKALEFMMQYFEWFSGENNQTLTCSQNSEKPFDCSKCDKKFALEEEAGKCCEEHQPADIPVSETEPKDGEEKTFFEMLDESSDKQIRGKSNPSQQPKNAVPRQGSSKDVELKEKPFTCATCGKKLQLEETESHKCKELSCTHCEKTFKKPANLKKHEKTHTVTPEPFKCTDCGKKFSIEGSKYKGKPSRCQECHKKFMMNPANRPVCDFYKAGQCKFGPKGQNKEGKCYNRHPEPCKKSSSGPCSDKKCTLMHTAPVCTFFKKQACERKFCKFTHPKPAPKPASNEGDKADFKQSRKQENSDLKKEECELKKQIEEKNHSNAQFAAINSKIDSFLEQVTKRINQMENTIEANAANNNRMSYQNAAFPPMMMQQNSQLQPMQRMM